MSSRLVVNSVRHTGASADAITMDASGNVTFPANATCSGNPTGFGKFTSYALLADRSTTDRGSYTEGDWRTREINTEVTDEDGIVTLSSNQFTLQAGKYFIKFGCCCYKVDYHVVRLRNITDSSDAGLAEGDYNRATVEVISYTRGATRINIASAKTFEVQGRVSTTQNTNGMGFGMPYSVAADFTSVEIFKEE